MQKNFKKFAHAWEIQGHAPDPPMQIFKTPAHARPEPPARNFPEWSKKILKMV